MSTKTPYRDSEIEFIERKSRFIGNVFLVYSEREARERIEAVERKHKAANHVVYAYDIRSENAVRFTDAGEPKGTAGLPVYEIFRREELTCYCCTVTRYFGGILLGAGGLIRAYANTAKLALEAAGIAELMPYARLSVSCDYPHFDIITAFLKTTDSETASTDFSDRVRLEIITPEADAAAIADTIKNKTAGRALIEPLGSELRPQLM